MRLGQLLRLLAAGVSCLGIGSATFALGARIINLPIQDAIPRIQISKIHMAPPQPVQPATPKSESSSITVKSLPAPVQPAVVQSKPGAAASAPKSVSVSPADSTNATSKSKRPNTGVVVDIGPRAAEKMASTQAGITAAAIRPVPAIQPDPDPRSSAPRTPEKKPTDIAPSEKFGIQVIASDGIILFGGRKIRNGTAFPNGELLLGTDPVKGMVETDRRVMIITP